MLLLTSCADWMATAMTHRGHRAGALIMHETVEFYCATCGKSLVVDRDDTALPPRTWLSEVLQRDPQWQWLHAEHNALYSTADEWRRATFHGHRAERAPMTRPTPSWARLARR